MITDTSCLFCKIAAREIPAEILHESDTVVAFRDMTPAQHADAYFGLLEALQGLLAYRVDLLEEGAIRNPYLRRSVDAAKRTLYAA